MRASEFLVEYNQAKTAQVFGHKLIAALASDRSSFLPNGLGTARAFLVQKKKIGSEIEPGSITQIVTDILSTLESADGTPNKQYTQWIAKCYANEGIHLEDVVSKMADWIKTYNQMKAKRVLPGTTNNISNLTADALSNLVRDPELLAKLHQAEDATAPKGEAVEIAKNNEVRVIKLEDEAAAKYYGQGTTWCTAARTNNMFERYSSRGTLYVILPAHPSYTGEKYQFHFETSSFMNQEDNPVDLSALADKYPSLRTIFKEQAKQNLTIGLLITSEQLSAAFPSFIKSVKYDVSRTINISNRRLSNKLAEILKPIVQQNLFNINIPVQRMVSALCYSDAICHHLSEKVTPRSLSNIESLNDRVSEIVDEHVGDVTSEYITSQVDIDSNDEAADILMMSMTELNGEFEMLLSEIIMDIVKQKITELLPA